jgi:hypothetical protein
MNPSSTIPEKPALAKAGAANEIMRKNKSGCGTLALSRSATS